MVEIAVEVVVTAPAGRGGKTGTVTAGDVTQRPRVEPGASGSPSSAEAGGTMVKPTANDHLSVRLGTPSLQAASTPHYLNYVLVTLISQPYTQNNNN